MIRRLILVFALLLAAPAAAQTFPALSGRIVDQANLLSPDQEAALNQRLEALEQASSRQLVIATVPSLEGYEIEDYGYRLGRHWQIGQGGANNGVVLIVAPTERKVRIEVGYGLEGIVTDALSSQIINGVILPRFRDNDYPGGIAAGTEAIIEQLQAPPEAAEQRARQAAQTATGRGPDMDTVGRYFPPIVTILIVLFVVSAVRSGLRGTPYRRRRRGAGPVVIWGPGSGGDSWGGSSGSSWSGGGSSWSGGGGFSGGGGSFGGGGASGGW